MQRRRDESTQSNYKMARITQFYFLLCDLRALASLRWIFSK